MIHKRRAVFNLKNCTFRKISFGNCKIEIIITVRIRNCIRIVTYIKLVEGLTVVFYHQRSAIHRSRKVGCIRRGSKRNRIKHQDIVAQRIRNAVIPITSDCAISRRCRLRCRRYPTAVYVIKRKCRNFDITAESTSLCDFNNIIARQIQQANPFLTIPA